MTPTLGYEYWISDGSTEGTKILKDIKAGTGDGCSWFSSRGVAYYGDEFFLTAEYSLWKSDGTQTGTVMVKDINPAGNSLSTGFNSVNHISLNELLLSAADGTNGVELWKTNGTEAGTVMVQDIATGSESSEPKGMTVSGDKLFFFADDGVYDYELWAMSLIPQGSILINGPLDGESGLEYTFTAEVTPPDTTTHVTYMWQTTDLQDVTHVGGLSDIVTFKWDTPGTKTVTVKASNLVNSLSAEVTIVIVGAGSDIYLPVIVRK